MHVLETDRLALRRLTLADAPFILELLNETGFLEHIGDKGVRNLADAERYLRLGPLASYAQHGFGLYLTSLKESGEPIGTCGLLKREDLDHPDVGFAFLARRHGRGYATEAARAVLEYGRETLGLEKIVAVTSLENAASAAVLEKIGLRFAGRVSFKGQDSRLFA